MVVFSTNVKIEPLLEISKIESNPEGKREQPCLGIMMIRKRGMFLLFGKVPFCRERIFFQAIFCLFFLKLLRTQDVSEYLAKKSQEITKSGWQKLTVNCQKNEKCEHRYSIYGYAIDHYSLIDAKRKILMEFTPKADCTSAIVAFFAMMGFEYNIDYKGWPHLFRDKYFNHRCGHATPCIYFDSSWFRFKVVRNPFDRAVSSYSYILTNPIFTAFLPKSLLNASFEEFIDHLTTLPLHELQEFATRHGAPQSHYYERYIAEKHLPPVFHLIVKVEEYEKGLKLFHEKTGLSFQINHKSNHYQVRKEKIQYFVGNLSWSEVRSKIPKNYGYFYSKKIKEKVEQLYKWDLLLYNYSYPFTVPLI